jgi:adenylate cyclase
LIAIVTFSAVVFLMFLYIFRRTEYAILHEADLRRKEAAARVEGRVIGELARAERALEDVDRAVRSGAVGANDASAVESKLFTAILGDPHLAEATLTRADLSGYDASGDAQMKPDGIWQVSVYRTTEGTVTTRLTKAEKGVFVAFARERGKDETFSTVPLVPRGPGMDPTKDETFSVLAARGRHGRAIWSDLHYDDLDAMLPVAQRRVVLSIQKTVEDGAGQFLGVARVAVLTDELDRIVKLRVDDASPDDPHKIALLAATGKNNELHLVARLDPSDRVAALDGELRILSDRPPPEFAALLADPRIKALDPAHPEATFVLDVGGVPYSATLRGLPSAPGAGTAGWMVAIVVPQAHYTRDLVGFKRNFFKIGVVMFLAVLVFGGFMLRTVQRGLGEIVETTAQMRQFDFAAADHASAFPEVDDVMKGLERAKTVVRAMGKYVPMDLVKRLYESNQEPALGGELCDVSIMFTDIEGFTTLSERLAPDELARRLGDYLEAMTVAIEKTEGTIDKYVGDAVMALWNAPSPVSSHGKAACRAALACMEATCALYASKAWAGLPPLTTRFGLHRARVMVGHFGAPTRISYTALGDGVNVAARLEPLCKQYGVTTLVSESIVEDAKDAFVFRRIDRVAVKGKSRGLDVYELLGAVGTAKAPRSS